jgi:integrase
MRVRDDFTVFPRKMPSGNVVFYYQCYDESGRRLCAHSTGETTRTMAVKKCNALMREGKLVPGKKTRMPTFGEYAESFWDWDTSEYLKSRKGRADISRSYVRSCEGRVRKQMAPYFGKMELDKITEHDIDAWLVGFGERERERATKLREGDGAKKGLSNSYANNCLKTLSLMLQEAVNRGIIGKNPAARVKALKKSRRKKELLTPGEVKMLFPARWQDVWADEIVCRANIVAACTGMRIGELLGLRGEYVFEDYIHVCGQYSDEYGYGPTKTRENRNIVIGNFVRGQLNRLREINGEGYLFSDNGGEAPIKRMKIYGGLRAALEKIGIGREEALRRGINLHAWRHFFNTTMRLSNVADSKVRAMTGHHSEDMTENYTDFDGREFAEIRDVQENVIAGMVEMRDADDAMLLTA